jgi:hypothetical protein
MTEQRLRDLFEFDAARAPQADGLASAARRRNRKRTGRLAISAAAVAVVGMSAGAAWLQADPAGEPPKQPGNAVAQGKQGPLPDDGAASCVELYSLQTLKHRAFAFDGTVVKIGPPRSNRPGVEMPLSGVTFRVNQWFRGGSAPTVVVDVTTTKAYEIGTRLLVSGEPRWGGEPLAQAIAWGCGFTRYYDPGTAAQWAR